MLVFLKQRDVLGGEIFGSKAGAVWAMLGKPELAGQPSWQ